MKPGRYQATAVDATVGRSSRSGTPQIEILFSIRGAEGTEEETVSFIGYLTDKSKEYTKKKMAVAGWKGTASVDDIRGTCEISISEEDYNGKTQQRVDIVTPFAGLRTAVKDRMGADEAASILLDATPAPRAREPGDDDGFAF
jgi:hypothetical protein